MFKTLNDPLTMKMVTYRRARKATVRRAEEIALETLIEGVKEFDFTPESLYKRYKKNIKHTLKNNKKAQQDLGKSTYGIIKDLLRF